MAIVPTYDRKIITTAPLRPAGLDNVSPEAFGSGLGRDIQRTAGIVQSQILEPAWQEANQARINDAALKLGQKRLELTKQLKNAKGEQSMVVGDEVSKEFTAYRDEVRKGLANDAQRAAFDHQAGHMGLGLDEQIGSHVDLQMREVAQQRATGLIDIHGKNAVDNRSDHGMAISDLDEAEATFEAYAKTQGMPPEAITANKAKIRSQYLSEIIASHLADNNATAARSWFAQHQAELAPAQRNSLAKAIEVEDLRGQSQKAADEIVSGAMASNSTTDGVHSGDWAATTAQALAGVQSIQDPRLRDEVQQRVEHALGLAQRIEDDRQLQTFTKAFETISAPGTSTDDIPATEWATLTVGQREHLQAVIDHRNGKAPDQATADQTWLDFNDMVSADNGRSLADMDKATLATTYKPHLDRDKWERVVSVWVAAREAAQKPEKAQELDSFLTANERFNEAMVTAEIDPKSDPKATARIKQAVDREIQTMSAAKGKKLTPDETQLAIDRVFMRKVMVDEWGRDSRKIAAMLTEDERGNAYIPLAEIPAAEQAHLRTRYPGATDDAMQKAYAAYLLGDKARADRIMRQGTNRTSGHTSLGYGQGG